MNYLQQLTDQLRRGSLSVLVVDDDPDIVSGMKDILENSGYNVVTAMYASEAMEHLEKSVFCAMICDYSLPDDNGVRLSRAAKKLQNDLVMILMTGHDPRHIKEKINKIDVEFMRKPVEVNVLLETLENGIEKVYETFEILRVSTTTPIPAPEPAPMSTGEKVASALSTLPDFPLFRKAWTFPLALSATALFAFSSGWITRTAVTPTTKPIPMAVSVMQEPPMTNLPAAKVIQELFIGPLAPPELAMAPEPEKPKPVVVQEDILRIKAAKAILKTNPRHAKSRQTLLSILADPLSNQHVTVIETIAALGLKDPEMTAVLVSASEDRDQPKVSIAAEKALVRLHPAPIAAAPAQPTPSSISLAPARTLDADGLDQLPDLEPVETEVAALKGGI